MGGYGPAMTLSEHPFDFDPWFRPAAALFGVHPSTAGVRLEDDTLDVRFGPWRVVTPLANVAGASVTGPYPVPKVIGGPHLSLADRGLTFATNARSGVCIRFAAPVRGIEPLGIVRHPGLTVTVADPAALAELLDRAAHVPGRTHAPPAFDPEAGEASPEPRDDAQSVTVEDLAEEVHDELRSLTAAELRRRARERGITGVSRRSKAELVDALEGEGT